MRLNRIDFHGPGSVVAWQSIDDRVMGGVSRSRLRFDPHGFAVFEGIVSLEQGGGFASVRCADLPLGMEVTRGYRLTVQGDGHRYKFTLRTDDGWDGVQYQAAFTAAIGPWSDVWLPVSDFRATWRGRAVPDAPPLSPGAVRQVGLLIGERQAGPFALAVRAIQCE